MRRLLSAALGVALAVLCCLAPPASAQVNGSVFNGKSPLRYKTCVYTFSTTTNVTAANVCVLPPGGAILRDVSLYQVGAGTGGTKWVATPKRATLALTSTDGGFTLAGGDNLSTNAAASPMGAITNPTGGTRPVVGGSVAASGTVTIAAGLAAGQKITLEGVDFTSVAAGATGNQWNVGADEDASAVNLAAAINASATYPIRSDVKATAALHVVTITARRAGTGGNAYTLTKAGANLTVSGSGTLASGFDALSSGGELVTMDVTLTGVYATAVSGVVTLYFEPRW